MLDDKIDKMLLYGPKYNKLIELEFVKDEPELEKEN